MELIEILRAIDRGLDIVAPHVGGKLGQALEIVDVAVESAIAFAAGGRDPVAEIQRIHAADPLLQEMRAEWGDAIKKKFGE